MILECPSCGNRYLVDPRALGSGGRTVRCASCQHQWFAAPPEEDILEEMEELVEPAPEVKPIPKGSSVPAIRKPKSKNMGVALSCLSLAILTFAAGAIYFREGLTDRMPGLWPIYNVVGLYSTEGIVLVEPAYFKEAVGLRDNHHLSGYLVNTTKETRRLPKLKITLLDDEGIPLKSQMFSEDTVLAPGEQKNFSPSLETSPDSVKRIIVEFGNPLELMLRK